MNDAPRGAFIQRDKKTYAIVPRSPMGLVTPDILENVARVARKHNIPVIKITSGQRLALVGLEPESVEEVWRDLGIDVGPAVGLCVHYVQACPGTTLCKYGIQDSLALAGELEKLFVNMETPAKTKISVSGCPMNCSEGYVRDFGVFGKKSGWTVVIGGNSGGRPRIGDVLAENLTSEEVIALAHKFFDYYRANAKNRERTARFVDRTGIEEIKKALL
ncbi:Nitrite/Sulfite reductase ferredoxin-like half domain-containing protein [Desulfotomaculum arcticum]|uniref:Nitrite/Sulfite reductase ferredoxin-like half domain-containing protein n=1 Tax=Desulfotruncus arcticus DSM 17038 TaxID=1121424 RepID=A0A1I2UEZ6_9FIRM|nr:NAD(P)/FAD-dependent oxidoreductase [Desulfotruncus arcticus]SFG75754.1 Nitrite/Sulfite reductase ferredoxin-like half domain-containing protein [Desulfotomaculum arcticum] [Desulfotruncus arcticus DSM 17038]